MDGWFQARRGLSSPTPLAQVTGAEGNDHLERMVSHDLGGGTDYPSLLLISNQFLSLEKSEDTEFAFKAQETALGPGELIYELDPEHAFSTGVT